jgi:hypothetical protein
MSVILQIKSQGRLVIFYPVEITFPYETRHETYPLSKWNNDLIKTIYGKYSCGVVGFSTAWTYATISKTDLKVKFNK